MSTRARSIRRLTIADFVVVAVAAIVFVVEVALLLMFINALFMDVQYREPVHLDSFLYLLAIVIVGPIASASVMLRGFRVRTKWAARRVPVAGIFARFSLLALGVWFIRIGWDGADSGIFISFYLVPTTLLLIVVAMTNFARRDRVVA